MDKNEVSFEIQDLLPIGLLIVVTGIGLAYGLSVMSDVKSEFIPADGVLSGCNSTNVTGCAADYQAASYSGEAVAKIPEKLPLIVTVIVAAIIIGILVRYLMVRMN